MRPVFGLAAPIAYALLPLSLPAGACSSPPLTAEARARQLRRSAVRVIERTYSEWKYHAERARLAAEGSSEGGPDAALHSYHAERRACAARCIQQYLARPQLQPAAGVAEAVVGAGAAGGAAGSAASGDECGYTRAQLELIRRVQRQFRALVSKQAEAAQELHNTSLREASSAAGTLPQHEHLCAILRQVYRERKGRKLQATPGTQALGSDRSRRPSRSSRGRCLSIWR